MPWQFVNRSGFQKYPCSELVSYLQKYNHRWRSLITYLSRSWLLTGTEQRQLIGCNKTMVLSTQTDLIKDIRRYLN